MYGIFSHTFTPRSTAFCEWRHYLLHWFLAWVIVIFSFLFTDGIWERSKVEGLWKVSKILFTTRSSGATTKSCLIMFVFFWRYEICHSCPCRWKEPQEGVEHVGTKMDGRTIGVLQSADHGQREGWLEGTYCCSPLKQCIRSVSSTINFLFLKSLHDP